MRRWSVAWFALILVGRAPAARAEPPEAQRVEITLVGELKRDPAFESRVTSWFDERRFAVSVRTAAALDAQRVLVPERAAVVFVWVTLSSDTRVRLFFASRAPVEGADTLYLLRELELEHGMDEIGAERAAQVLYLSTIALLEGQEHSGREEIERGLVESAPASSAAPAAGTPEPSRSARKPLPGAETATPEAPPRRGLRVDAGVGYGLSFRDEEGLWHGPRAALELSGTSGLGLRVALASALPHAEQFGSVELEFSAASLLLAGLLRKPLTPALSLGGFAGPNLEVVRYAPAPDADAAVTPGDAAFSVRPGASVGVLAALGTSPRFGLVIEATIAFVRSEYALESGARRERVGRASLLAPSAALEVLF